MSRDPLSVHELTTHIKATVEGEFPTVTVQGEISNFTRARSGHLYFSLKDDRAELPAVMWKGSASRLRFDVQPGLEVVARGGVEVYVPRGKYQLVCRELQPVGMGPLELAFQQLHDRLAQEGLFRDERKRPLPQFPRRIALVTSPTGAAVRDMLQVLSRRWPAATVVVVPVPVQGERAAGQIARGLAAADRLRVDVVLCGRGGGSLEDLWAFNEEVVARALAAMHTPVVSAVGHEIDVTIADLVADRRALTPSEGAELIVPQRDELQYGVAAAAERMTNLLQSRWQQAARELEQLRSRRVLSHPLDRVHSAAQQLDDTTRSLQRAIEQRSKSAAHELGDVVGRLDALSPLAVLQRGYTLTQRANGDVVRSAADVTVGDRLTTRLPDGEIVSEVVRE